MNVLFLAPDFFPVWGGAGTYIIELVKNLPRDYEIHIATIDRANFKKGGKSTSSAELDKIFPPNVHIHYITKAKGTFAYNINYQLTIATEIRKLIREHDIDVVHTQSSMPDLLCPVKKMGVPVITTIHNSSEMQIAGWKRSRSKFSHLETSEKMIVVGKPIFKLSERYYYSQKRMNITVSEWSKRQFMRYYNMPEESTRVVYNGVDNEQYNPAKRDEKLFDPIDPDNKGPRVLFLSRMLELKGITPLLKAIPIVLDSVDASFLFAGPGNTSRIKGDTKGIKYLGYIDHEKTPAYIASSDVFVLPSFGENFPFSLLEAMACQVACVSTTVGGIPEMIENEVDGLLDDPGDHEKFAKSIIRMIEDDDLRKTLAMNGRKRVVRDFTWQKAAGEVADLYDEITHRPC